MNSKDILELINIILCNSKEDDRKKLCEIDTLVAGYFDEKTK